MATVGVFVRRRGWPGGSCVQRSEHLAVHFARFPGHHQLHVPLLNMAIMTMAVGLSRKSTG